MNEEAAREVLLVRAIEGADSAGKILTNGDRGHAARAAAELVRWQGAERGAPATAEAFVVKRAELLAARLAELFPRLRRAHRAVRWHPWIGFALPLVALAAGVVAEHVADRRHVSILAFPLLGIVAWNAAVYAWLLARRVTGLAADGAGDPGAIRGFLAGVRRDAPIREAGPLASALAAFGADWAKRAAPLFAARAGRVLHLSAALLALGAVAGMFVRGLAFEYRAGWESTFLDAGAVHAILQAFLLPAAWLTGLALPSVEEVAALRWSAGAAGENAARWIYLHSVTVMAIVVVPRLCLAALAWHRERSLAARFPLSLEEPYFRRVLSGWREKPAFVRVVAYAYTPGEEATQGLHRLASGLFGDDVHVHMARPIAFGDEDDVASGGEDASRPADLVIALFSLGSTPEIENHGVFLDAMQARAGSAMAVIVDESAYRQRLGNQAGAKARLSERRRSWSGFAGARGLGAVFVDLASEELVAAQRDLETRLSAPGATP